MPWYKGNFHCHSTNSDGNASPLEVANYYKALKMDFIAISDHNRLTMPDEYQSVLTPEFIGIPCCEYSGAKCCHVVSVDVETTVAPCAEQETWDTTKILQDGIDRTHEADGIPILCHPCWNWTYDHNTILRLHHATHFELFNALPDNNSYPVAGTSPVEEIWDKVLTADVRIFGTASDDAHWYGDVSSYGTILNHIPFGGTGWNVIKARDLSRQTIRNAFESGQFYATTGIELADYRVTSDRIDISVKQWSHENIVTEFVGQNGQLLDRQTGLNASYKIKGDEKYIRVRLADTAGCFAYAQPVFLDTIDHDIAWTQE